MRKVISFRVFIVLSILLFGRLVTSAQKFSAGIKVGPSLSWANFGDKDDKDFFTHKVKPGFSIQGLINFPLKNNYSFQSELGYSLRGRKILFNDDTWENNATYNFGDLSMMLRKSFKFELGKKNIPATWFINVGPHISYWINGSGKLVVGGIEYPYKIVYGKLPESPPSPDFDKMYLSNINRWLFGIDFGVGFSAPIKEKTKIFAELRFTSGHTYYGTKSSATSRTFNFFDNMQSNEKIVSLTVAYTFDLDLKLRKKGRSTKDAENKSKTNKKKRRR